MNLSRIIGIPANLLPMLENAITKIRSPKSPRSSPTLLNFDPGPTLSESKTEILSNDSAPLPSRNILIESVTPKAAAQGNSLSGGVALGNSLPGSPKAKKNYNNIDKNLYSPLSKLTNSFKPSEPIKISFRKINQSSLETLSERNYVENVNKGKVLYPIFEKALKLINDDFWINILINFSHGKFKRGFSYRENYLYYKNKEKIHIDQEDPLKALNQLQFFMRTKAGIMSETDRINEQQIVQQKLNQINESKKYEWSDIKNNNYRTILLERYITKLSKYYNLNSEEILQLKTNLYFGLILGELNQTIKLENNNIVLISNLSFDQETRKFRVVKVGKKGASKKSKPTAKEPKSNKYSLNKSFIELVKFLDKKKTRQLNENDKLESYMYSTIGSEERSSENVTSERDVSEESPISAS